MTLNGLVECPSRPEVPGKICYGRHIGLASGIKLFFAAVICCIGIRAKAALSTMTVTASVAPQLAGFYDVPVTFQKFDPGLGKLSSVEIILQGTGEISQQYENTADFSSSKHVHQTLNLVLTTQNAGGSFLSAHQNENHKYSAGAFDGDIDFAGPSGDSAIYGVDISKTKVVQSRPNLAMFTGSDLAQMFLSSQTYFRVSPSDKHSIVEAQALVGADISIIYNYISAPEPAWYGMFAGALGLVCTLRKIEPQKKRQS